MIWALYFSILFLVAILFIFTSRRRKTVTYETTYEPPTKVEREDFAELSADTLVVVFTSNACGSCADVLAKAQVLNSDAVNVAVVEYNSTKGKKLHEKYQIEAVPTLVIADKTGMVTFSNVGPVSATDIWAGAARNRGDDVAACH